MAEQEWRAFLKRQERRRIGFDVGGIDLFEEDGLEAQQAEYSGLPGWERTWFVVGVEETFGDPLVLDTGDPGLPLLAYSIEYEGDAPARRIADSIAGFERAFEAFRAVAHGREDPAAVSENPLGEAERTAFLDNVREANPHSEVGWWETLVQTD